MGPKSYSKADHKQAFEVYYETRTYYQVSQAIGCNYDTPQRWSKKDFNCKDGCPWHGWAELIAERDAAMQARLDLLKEGDTNPLHHAAAMGKALQNLDREVAPTVKSLIRTDMERLAHMELLYGKVFHDLTGIALAYDELRDPEGVPMNMKDVYYKGLRFLNAGEAIRILGLLMDRIHLLEGRVGISGTRKEEALEEGATTISITELREVRKMLTTTSPKVVSTLLDNLRDGETLDVRSVKRESVAEPARRSG